ncbi:hypothetical protein BKA70DRAFT_1352806 [Coprinopsis sp. MPI-PUGE-AT-0042]|nr:hypothetical protein BKA70DRAFT_1352806 [Coprinopsis sp. MPI-PUGE-AT-0042]
MRHIPDNRVGAGIKPYISRNVTPWFLRAGEAAPLTLQVYGPVPGTVSGVMDFVSGFNITTLAFSTPHDVLPTGDLSYSSLQNLGISPPIPVPVEHLTFEFQHNPLFQPSSREVVDLTHNFPNLTHLCLIEFTSPNFNFPVQIIHATLVELHLVSLVLSPTEIYLLLSGLPQLERLLLEDCEGRPAPTSRSYEHRSLNKLRISDTIPEDCLVDLTCPALKSVTIDGASSSLHDPNAGRLLGQFLQRCAVGHIYLAGEWPGKLLDNVLCINTTLAALSVDFVSSFNAPPGSGHHHLIKLPSSLALIAVCEVAAHSALAQFCKHVTLSDGQSLLIMMSDREPWAVAYFPWPRQEEGQDYVLGQTADLIGWGASSDRHVLNGLKHLLPGFPIQKCL